jgi:hypothetical protein
LVTITKIKIFHLQVITWNRLTEVEVCLEDILRGLEADL